jgi:hypothetical protein
MKTNPAKEKTRGIPRRKNRQAKSAGEKGKTKQKVMKTAAIAGFGPPSVLKVTNLPVPEAGPGEILIALHAAGVGSGIPRFAPGGGPRADPGSPWSSAPTEREL